MRRRLSAALVVLALSFASPAAAQQASQHQEINQAWTYLEARQFNKGEQILKKAYKSTKWGPVNAELHFALSAIFFEKRNAMASYQWLSDAVKTRTERHFDWQPGDGWDRRIDSRKKFIERNFGIVKLKLPRGKPLAPLKDPEVPDPLVREFADGIAGSVAAAAKEGQSTLWLVVPKGTYWVGEALLTVEAGTLDLTKAVEWELEADIGRARADYKTRADALAAGNSMAKAKAEELRAAQVAAEAHATQQEAEAKRTAQETRAQEAADAAKAKADAAKAAEQEKLASASSAEREKAELAAKQAAMAEESARLAAEQAATQDQREAEAKAKEAARLKALADAKAAMDANAAAEADAEAAAKAKAEAKAQAAAEAEARRQARAGSLTQLGGGVRVAGGAGVVIGMKVLGDSDAPGAGAGVDVEGGYDIGIPDTPLALRFGAQYGLLPVPACATRQTSAHLGGLHVGPRLAAGLAPNAWFTGTAGLRIGGGRAQLDADTRQGCAQDDLAGAEAGWAVRLGESGADGTVSLADLGWNGGIFALGPFLEVGILAAPTDSGPRIGFGVQLAYDRLIPMLDEARTVRYISSANGSVASTEVGTLDGQASLGRFTVGVRGVLLVP